MKKVILFYILASCSLMAVCFAQTFSGSGISSANQTALGSVAAGNSGGQTNYPASNIVGQLPASAIVYRAGQQSVGNLSTSQAVSFSSPFVSSVGTNYVIFMTPNGSLASAVAFGASSKTTNGFTMVLSAGIAGGVTCDYMAIPNQ